MIHHPPLASQICEIWLLLSFTSSLRVKGAHMRRSFEEEKLCPATFPLINCQAFLLVELHSGSQDQRPILDPDEYDLSGKNNAKYLERIVSSGGGMGRAEFQSKLCFGQVPLLLWASSVKGSVCTELLSFLVTFLQLWE